MWLLIAKYSLISGISWVPFCRPWGWCWQRLGIMCCSTLFCWITVEWFTRAWNHQTSNCKFVSTGETYLRAPLLCLGWGGTPLLSLRWRWASTWWNSRLCSRLCRLRYVSHWSTATIRRLPRWSRGTSAIHCCHLCTYKNNTESQLTHTQSQTLVSKYAVVLFVLESNFILLFLGYGTVKIKFETSESQHIFIYTLWFTFVLSQNVILFSFKCIIIHYWNQKQKGINFKPR